MNSDMMMENDAAPLQQVHRLLEQQIRQVQKSDYRGVDRSMGDIGLLIQKLSENPPALRPAVREKITQILDLYAKLELMIETEKERAKTQLQKVNSGKKTIRAYQH